jgi:hypothetical protein
MVFINSLLVQTVLVDGRCKCIHLTKVEPGIKYLLWEGMPRKGSSLAKHSGLSSYLIGMENSRFLCSVTDCHGLLSRASWLRVADQVVWQGAGSLPAILNSEIPQGLSLLNLTSSSVWWHGPLAPQEVSQVAHLTS